jgi:diguanylate cyclase (GGDEF)-like protein
MNRPNIAQPSRVLLIDDDQDIHSLVALQLRQINVQLSSALRGEEGMQAAAAQKPDLVLLDYQMPDTNGLEVLKQFKNDAALRNIPVVIVTGNDQHTLLTESFEAGAADYVRKPFCAAELRARVRNVIENRRMVAELERLALHDGLTALPNRTFLQNSIQRAIHRARRVDKYHFAVLYLDFDRFKSINDSLGHEVGDLFLQEIAERMQKTLRATDMVSRGADSPFAARLGGDEFVILLDAIAKPEDAVVVGHRLLKILSEPYHLAGREVSSSASIGIVTSDGSYNSAQEMLRDADAAMYQAKSGGRNRLFVFDATMRQKVENKIRIESEIGNAIRTQQFCLVYQPIVNLQTTQIVGVEALVRWRHPDFGLIPPMEFIPIAEENGSIVALGEWILEESCRQMVLWHHQLGPLCPNKVCVNLSRKQLMVGQIPQTVARLLQKYQMPAQALELEVTESLVMTDLKKASAVLSELRAMGVSIAIDDFGTGHSSLACLHELPISTLKIDRSFVKKIDCGGESVGVAIAVIRMAALMKLQLVAEGIETTGQWESLRCLDCEMGQGYLFAKPMPASELSSRLQSFGRKFTPPPPQTAASAVVVTSTPVASQPLNTT